MLPQVVPRICFMNKLITQWTVKALIKMFDNATPAD